MRTCACKLLVVVADLLFPFAACRILTIGVSGWILNKLEALCRARPDQDGKLRVYVVLEDSVMLYRCDSVPLCAHSNGVR